MAAPGFPGSGGPGGSGWEGWEKDEGKRALEFYHSTTLFRDADEDTDTDTITSGVAQSASQRRQDSSESGDEECSNRELENQYRAMKQVRMKKFFLAIAVVSATVSLATGTLYFLNKGGVINLVPEGDVQSTRSQFYEMENTVHNVSIPENYRHLKDVVEVPMDDDTALPLLWDIPGDGDVIQHILSSCVGLVAAGGALGDPRQTNVTNESLAIFHAGDRSYVNVFAGNLPGLQRARDLKLVESKLADIMYTPLVFEAATLFSEAAPGRMLAMFHHPVHRVASVFHIYRTIQADCQNMTLEEFLDSPPGAYNSNWLTRELSGGASGDIDETHFEISREVLMKKCLVGVTHDIEESLERFFDFFGWEGHGEEYFACEKRILESEGLDRLYFDLVRENTTEWNLIEKANYYDMRLWEVIEMLAKSQMGVGGMGR